MYDWKHSDFLNFLSVVCCVLCVVCCVLCVVCCATIYLKYLGLNDLLMNSIVSLELFHKITLQFKINIFI